MEVQTGPTSLTDLKMLKFRYLGTGMFILVKFRYLCTGMFILVSFNSKNLGITSMLITKVITKQIIVKMSIQPLKVMVSNIIL